MKNKNLHFMLTHDLGNGTDYKISMICSNRIRASILYLLIKNPDTSYSMQVEEMSFRMGLRPRILIYHLEKLSEWGLVEVKKNQKYGKKQRRVIWGLNLSHSDLVKNCYKIVKDHFFDKGELEELIKSNKSFRKK